MQPEPRRDSQEHNSERLLTIAEVRSLTKLSDRQIRRMIVDGRLAAVRLRGVRAVRVRESALLALVEP